MTSVNEQTFEVESIDQLGGVLKSVFADVEGAFNDMSFVPLLGDIMTDLSKDHAGYFDDDADATGAAWQPLAPATVQKKGHATILEDTGAMKASLVGQTGDSIRDVFDGGPQEGLAFGTSDPKAPFHQEGTSRMPARPPVGMTEQRADTIAEQTADSAIEQLKG